MVILQGKGVSDGIAKGPLFFYEKKNKKQNTYVIEDSRAEIDRLIDAKNKAVKELEQIYEESCATLGEDNAEIFQIHGMMLEDEDFFSSIEEAILTNKVNAEEAVRLAAVSFAQMLIDTGDSYISARSADVKDISNRLIDVLSGAQNTGVSISIPSIFVADDLVPSETVQLDRTKVLGLITEKGTYNSHSAIIARSMNIPAIIGIDSSLLALYKGREVIVDGKSGTVYVDPDATTMNEFTFKNENSQVEKSNLNELIGKENITLDGRTVEVFANIGSEKEAQNALSNDAGGIGLLRSEFLYLERSSFPSEDDLYIAYRSVVEMMSGKKVIIRTLDIGADKQVDYFNIPREDNPAMGMRAIRISLSRPEIFLTQLRAILRASAWGRVALMFPMIISLDEIIRCKQMLSTAKKSLDAEGIFYDKKIECGIMIETPAAALISDTLAKEVDFFSIGTNDLTQYTLAIDRQNPAIESFCDSRHEAILRLIEMTVKNAHDNEIWVGICGELGADLELTERFLKMGIDEFSVSPAYILPLRKKIRESKGLVYKQ